MTTEEMSRDHIDRLYSETLEVVARAEFNQTFSLREVLGEYLDRELDLRGIADAKSKLETFLHHNHYSPFKKSVCQPIAHALWKFVHDLRRYYVSDEMRKEIDKGTQFRSELKKRKLQTYLQCTDLRALACQKYRELIREVADLVASNEDLSPDDQQAVLRELHSELRCENCGTGPTRHRRPGLLVKDVGARAAHEPVQQ